MCRAHRKTQGYILGVCGKFLEMRSRCQKEQRNFVSEANPFSESRTNYYKSVRLETYHDSEDLLSQDPKEKEPPEKQNHWCHSSPSWLRRLWKPEPRGWKAEQSFWFTRGVKFRATRGRISGKYPQFSLGLCVGLAIHGPYFLHRNFRVCRVP